MAAQPRDVVEQYVKLVATGPTSAVVDLYAEDAVVEDPIGTPERRGHEAIGELYKALENLDRETELHTVKVAGNQVAAHFTLVTVSNGHRMTLSPIDVMELNDEGKIISMRAYWSPEDLKMEQI
ncbi:nuclear transport factor 2 family protein [Nocardia sp. CDC153]|uniref:nuclear transport factor 2 family protein n=1 Tax=Nocardia sp. CDC153 TaxID=3112167 RepID=UPI002DB7E001|nr:nuclear transport factor 2 family protein [Nocardia sp. CDC153]MEC3957206.1 nuclear transport factor 2 family protein [Nocardia sp. CDC153]